jgi:predicted RNA binding protein YcfA (HicA-like mRNA interferase family)
MTRLLKVKGKELIKILNVHGFSIVRTKESHHFMRYPDGYRTVVPVHSGETLESGLLLKNLKDTELSQDDIIQ